MYNPDQHYQAHRLHLQQLVEQAEQRQLLTALPQQRSVTVRAAGTRLGTLLVRLGTWLARNPQRDEQSASTIQNTSGDCCATES